MSKKFGWTEWDNHLLDLKGKPVKILEIGIDKGNVMKKFIDVFLNTNNLAEYYGVDNWNYSDESAEIIDNIKENYSNKNNIHLIKKDASIGLSILLSKKILFNIIYINSLYISKIMTCDPDFFLVFKLLAKNGIIIFDDYIIPKINSFVNDILIKGKENKFTILYVGYQIIIKNEYLNNTKTDKIINSFNSFFDKYWNNNKIINLGIIINQPKIPDINPVFEDYTNLKFKELKDIDIIRESDLKHFMYKYIEVPDITETLENKINESKDKSKDESKDESEDGSKDGSEKLKLHKMLETSKYNKYSLFNSITGKMNKLKNCDSKQVDITNILLADEIIDVKKLEEKYKFNNYIYKSFINNRFINIFGALDNKNSIDILFENIKKDGISTHSFEGVSVFRRLDFSKMYNYILLQILLFRYTLSKTGTFRISISTRFEFISDLLLLLSCIFEKISLLVIPNKIDNFLIKIRCYRFLGISDDLFNKIYDIISSTDKEIISIFNQKKLNILIDIDSIQNNIFKQTKKIINFIKKYKLTLINNIDKINNSIRKRTIDDMSNYLFIASH